MASPIVYGAGFAGTGADSAIAVPVWTSSATIWLNSNGGNDANAGTEPELPVATIAQAVTNASANSVICIAAGHTQTIAGTQLLNKAGLRLVGFGTGTNRPQFTPSSGATNMFAVSAANVVIENIYFKAAAATSGTGGRVSFNSSGGQMINCQIDCGASDGEGLVFNAQANCRVSGCTFTAVASRPTRALNHAGGASNNFVMANCTFDGATFGWAGIACTPTAATDMVISGLTLTGNSDLVAAVTSYQIFGYTVSGASRLQIT